MDHYEKECSNLQHDFDLFQEEMETFSLVNDVYGDASMMIEGDGLEVSSSVEDFGVLDPEMVPSVQEEVSHGDLNQGFTWCTCCWLVLRLLGAGYSTCRLNTHQIWVSAVLGVIHCKESPTALQQD